MIGISLSATLLATAFVFSSVTLQQPLDSNLESGIRQAQEGDFEAAITTLDEVVRRLATQPGRARSLARAYTYLSIAYLGLSQEQTAKAKFLEALKTDNQMEISTKEFPPRILKFFEDLKKEAGVVDTAAPSPKTQRAGSEPGDVQAVGAVPAVAARKGRSRLPLVLGGVALVGGGVAVAAASGGGDGTTTPTTASPATLTGRWTGGGVDGFHLRSANCFEDDDVILDLVQTGASLSGTLRTAARAANCEQVGKVVDFVVTGNVNGANLVLAIRNSMGHMDLTGTVDSRRMSGTLVGGPVGAGDTFGGTWAMTR